MESSGQFLVTTAVTHLMNMKPTAHPQYGPYIATRQPLSRRTFLRGTGIALALPLLNSMSWAKAVP